MNIFIFARFHARPGAESELGAVITAQVERVRHEPGCIEIEAFRAVRARGQYFLRSRWSDEAAFDVHVDLPSTDRFIADAEALMDHPFDAWRTERIA